MRTSPMEPSEIDILPATYEVPSAEDEVQIPFQSMPTATRREPSSPENLRPVRLDVSFRWIAQRFLLDTKHALQVEPAVQHLPKTSARKIRREALGALDSKPRSCRPCQHWPWTA